MLNERMSDVAFEGVYRYQSRLHLVHRTIFPHLAHLPLDDWPDCCSGDTGLEGGKPVEGAAAAAADGEKKVVAACTNLRFQYRPRKGISR